MKNKVNPEAMKAIKAIFNSLINEPETRISTTGCGYSARSINEHGVLNQSESRTCANIKKVIVGGDTFDEAKFQLKFVLIDLASDCGLSDEMIEAIRKL